MTDDYSDYFDKFLSFDACERAAAIMRQRLGLDNAEAIPAISGVLVKLGFECVVRSESSMAGQDAFAIPAEGEIHFRQDVFERVLDDEAAARFIGLHEAAHGLVHEGHKRYFKMTDDNVLLPFVSDDESTEVQADRIARATAMPVKMIEQCNGASELARRARVPLRQAVARLQDLLARSSRPAPIEAASEVVRLRVASAKTGAAHEKAKADDRKLRLWQVLPQVAGEDPSLNRECEGHWIKWQEFGRTTQCGWFIENGAARSWFASRHR